MRYLIIPLCCVPLIVQAPYAPKFVAKKIRHTTTVSVPKKQAIDPSEAKCLATMIYGEARGESERGQIAVAYTAVNRATKKSVCKVVLAPKQYSVFNNNPALKLAATSIHVEPVQKNSIDEKSWKQAVRVANIVLKKKVEDPTKGATHYLAPELMKKKKYRYPKWSKVYQLTAVIDKHSFYKKPT